MISYNDKLQSKLQGMISYNLFKKIHGYSANTGFKDNEIEMNSNRGFKHNQLQVNLNRRYTKFI